MENDRRGHIVVVTPRLEMAAVDVVVSYAPAPSFAAAATLAAGKIATRAEDRQRSAVRRDMPGRAPIRVVPPAFAVESCRRMGRAALKLMSDLGDIASVSGRTPKGAAMQLLCVAQQKGKAISIIRSIRTAEPGSGAWRRCSGESHMRRTAPVVQLSSRPSSWQASGQVVSGQSSSQSGPRACEAVECQWRRRGRRPSRAPPPACLTGPS